MRRDAPRPVLIALIALAATAFSALGCSSDEPEQPPVFNGPILSDAFDGALAVPGVWDSAAGDVAVVDDPTAPTGGKALLVRAMAPKRVQATLRKAFTAPRAKSVTCTLRVNVRKSSTTGPQTIARIDVVGGAVFVDVQESGWRMFGTFGVQSFDQASKRPSKARWATVAVTIENTGKIAGTLEGEQLFHNLDVKATPVDVAKGALEIGVFAPPSDIDSEAAFDDVVCIAK